MANKPLHQKGKDLRAPLDKKLREKFRKRSLTIRKGDEVEVRKGSNKGKKGKVVKVSSEKGFVYIEKVVRKKINGEEIMIPFRAENLKIIVPETSDSKRIKKKGEKNGK